ncbi:hypothetical protein SLEP1_g44412 [Rubroshorea leprosula]|uniref:Reverse transcriptase n=1 Tax=Rubroshorea leprosula TaxID=152421 RepID=A0AAV5LG44_9ROSI|nr:hypothetical protein SLEP1_g44412 [Rubroshorea leprosula]
MRVKQRDRESLKNYMSRFNDAVLEVDSFDQAVGIATVISGPNHERFRDSFIKHPATTFNERDENQSRKRMRTAQNRGPMSTSTLRFGRPNSAPPQQSAGKPPVTRTPFNLPRSQIFMQSKNKMDLRRPGPMRTVAATRDHTRYCDFHQDHGHTTEQCNSLKSKLESLAQKGMQGMGYQQAPPPLPPPARIIHMITGELEAGGLSSKQRKLYVREVKHQNQAQKRKLNDADWKDQPITFTPNDFKGVVIPHNDPLVTSVMINNCQVQRVLVDTGSAPDIIGRTYVTPSVRFLVVKMPSSFNVVIGRPTLTKIRAVVSQTHLYMKFPTPMGIATLRGNQEVIRHCYLTSVTKPQKNIDQPAENRPQKIHDNRQVMGVEILDNRPDDETRAAPGIPTLVSQHKLSTNPLKKPLAQKRRLFGGERLKVIKEEVEKLLQAGFIKWVDYCKWVANPVLVKKANGKWRMCINYTNLHHACPKDCHPMPNNDRLVEAAFGNERLSLWDAYFGYHQVPMAPEDEEKTSFYVEDEIYCYMMMPFGLKNAGATYQKMVTIIFRAQIGWNLEVYVDDIVNRMRLNPAKCIFGVEFGKFLGFMVSKRGIEVNLEKIKIVAEMEPLKSVKDVQRLTGRVAALHRFISKSVHKCLPFFKIMRLAAQKDESGKQKKFEWNSECQAAFDELKFYLSSPPLLTKANDGEILSLYLGISDEAISSVLVRKEGKQQKPVYYTKSVLYRAEIRYSIAKKATLAIVTSAKKLRPYFQSHPIIVLTDQPFRQILQKQECSGGLIKWAVELGEFEITFQQRSAIRAQALANFIVECTSAHSDSQLELDS